MAITTTTEIEQHLKASRTPFTKITPLPSSTNFLWRIRAPDSSTTIIKHAEPYAKDTPNVPYNTDRMAFEQKALEILPQIIPQDDILRLPTLRLYDAKHKILQLSDAGPRTLKEAYTDHMLNIPALGRRIGKWLARFHASTRGSEARNAFRNGTTKDMYDEMYETVPAIFAEYDHDASTAESINLKYGPLFQSASECVCHGDFSPENIVVQSAIAYAWSNHKLTVVDWEKVRWVRCY